MSVREEVIHALHRIRHVDYERPAVLEMIRHYAPGGARILDVGCGFGRYLSALEREGHRVTGVEKNPSIRLRLLQGGKDCLAPEEFRYSKKKYDVILMAHIIEHFPPQDLIPFMETYLERLERGGVLVIATPLMNPFFFNDLDHVKPYHPSALTQFFGPKQSQVSYLAKNRIELVDLRFMTRPFGVNGVKDKFVHTILSKSYYIYETFMAFLYRLTGGFVGYKDRWIGVYRKVA
jgi:SAM-dependent methyltransferase